MTNERRCGAASESTAAHTASQPLVAVFAAAAAGMTVDRLRAPAFGAWIAASAALLVAWWFARGRTAGDPRRDVVASAALLAACATVGGAWHHAQWRLFRADDVGHYADVEPRSIVVEGVLVDAPRIARAPQSWTGGGASTSELKTRFALRVDRLRDDAAWREASGRTDVQVDGEFDAASAGDRVRMFARLACSPPALNPGEFDFAEHYRAERTLCVLRVARAASIEVVARHAWWDPLAALARWRAAAHRTLLERLPREQVGFASALLLGFRDQMDRRDNLAFFRTGTVHILSISGLHIAMLALFLNGALRIGWLRRTTAALVTGGVTVAYACVIDAEPPAVRAAVVVVAVVAATTVARRPLNMNVLAASALVVSANNPNELFRAGPQLSFLAAAVLAWAAGRRDEEPIDDGHAPSAAGESTFARWRRRWRRWTGPLWVSAAIFAVTAPLVAHRFHIASPISLLVSPIVALPVALGLLAGFLTITLGRLVPATADPLGTLCGANLGVIEFVVERTQFWPGGAFWLPGPSTAAVLGFYLLIVAASLAPRSSRRRRGIAIAALTWGAASMVPRYELPPDLALRTTFISVGHGLSVLVERPDGDPWLYDCGRLGSDAAAARSISGVLWSRGISRLDAIVVSHGDADHYNGLPWLLEQFTVRRVYAAAALLESASPAAAQIRGVAAERAIELLPVAAVDVAPWSAGASYRAAVRQPQPGETFETDNASSLVVALEARGRRLLLTGDLEGSGLNALLRRPGERFDVLLAPHHGSARSNPPGLAEWCRPAWVVVSGHADRSGLLRTAYENVGARVLETTAVGAVTVTIDRAGRLEVRTFR